MQELHESLAELDYEYNNEIISYIEYENLHKRVWNELNIPAYLPDRAVVGKFL